MLANFVQFFQQQYWCCQHPKFTSWQIWLCWFLQTGQCYQQARICHCQWWGSFKFHISLKKSIFQCLLTASCQSGAPGPHAQWPVEEGWGPGAGRWPRRPSGEVWTVSRMWRRRRCVARPAVCQTAMSRLCSETQLSSLVGSVSVYLDGLDQVWSFDWFSFSSGYF